MNTAPRSDEPHAGTSGSLNRIILQYVQQLTVGCGDTRCTESLCHTGLQNTSQHRQIRPFTPRSARAVAIAIVGGPSPRRHLCPYFVSQPYDTANDAVKSKDGPRDPSAFLQLLNDTTAIRKLCDPGPVQRYTEGEQLERLYRSLDPLMINTSIEDFKAGDHVLSNDEASEIICHCFQWILAQMPVTTEAQFRSIDLLVKNGNACPTYRTGTTGEAKEKWLSILDSLYHAPSLCLLRRILQVVASRIHLEGTVKKAKGTSIDITFNERQRKGCSIASSIVRKLATDASTSLKSVLCLKTAFLMYWTGKAVVPNLSTTRAALDLLEAWRESLGDETISLPAITARIDVVEVATSWPACPEEASDVHLLAYHFLFGPKERAVYFRCINYLKMREAHSATEKAAELRRYVALETVQIAETDYEERHYLLLNVSRENILRDAYDQMWHRRRSDLLRPLRVRLGELNELEVGHDLGGVQVEFFNLICKEAFAEEAQILTTDESTGLCYFRRGSLSPLYMFKLLGSLFALALYNGITLPVNMPTAFYGALMLQDASLALSTWPQTFQDGWPTTWKSLSALMADDIADLEYSFPLEANGLRMDITMPSRPWKTIPTLGVASLAPISRTGATSVDVQCLEWPGWRFETPSTEPPSVTEDNKEQYVADYMYWTVIGSVKPQLNAFCHGFHAIIEPHSLSMFTPNALKALVEGSNQLDIDELRRATRYEGYDPKSKYIQSFWCVVLSWPEGKQMQLLKFVTAVERVPLGGASNLRFVIERTEPGTMDYLPTSSTCFGTLRLPRYRTSQVLDEKLSLAIRYGLEGFGTG